ncbi:MAG: hypothetical protein M1457_10195 [bacterium]|nr:hypothetical protein [bacterium]
MTDRAQILAALNEAFNLKYHSAARYMLDAEPYVKNGDEVMLREIEAIAGEDAAAADRLASLIERLEGVPQVGVFELGVADLNYLSLRHLAGVLIGILEKQRGQFAAALAAAKGDAEVRGEFDRLVNAADDHIARLKALK